NPDHRAAQAGFAAQIQSRNIAQGYPYFLPHSQMRWRQVRTNRLAFGWFRDYRGWFRCDRYEFIRYRADEVQIALAFGSPAGLIAKPYLPPDNPCHRITFRAADYVDQAAARNPANYRRSDVRLLAQVQPRYIWQDDGIFPDCQPREQQAGAGIFADDHRGSDLRGGSRGHSLTFNAAEDDDGSIRRDAIIINCAKVIEQETDAAGHNRGVGFTRLRTAEAGIRENLAF